MFGTWDTGLSPSGNLYLESVMKEMVSEKWEDHLNCKFLLVALHFTCLIFTLENTDKKINRDIGVKLFSSFLFLTWNVLMSYQNLPNYPHPSGSDVWGIRFEITRLIHHHPKEEGDILWGDRLTDFLANTHSELVIRVFCSWYLKWSDLNFDNDHLSSHRLLTSHVSICFHCLGNS